MEQALQVFEPLKNPAWSAGLVLFAVLAAVAGLALKGYVGQSMDRNRRMLLAMLLFFGAMISLFTSAGMFINSAKFRQVAVHASGISIGKHLIPFSDMRGYLIREDRSQSWVNPNMVKKTVRSLVIEEKTGKTHLLPEEYYDLKQLIPALDSAYTAWKNL